MVAPFTTEYSSSSSSHHSAAAARRSCHTNNCAHKEEEEGEDDNNNKSAAVLCCDTTTTITNPRYMMMLSSRNTALAARRSRSTSRSARRNNPKEVIAMMATIVLLVMMMMMVSSPSPLAGVVVVTAFTVKQPRLVVATTVARQQVIVDDDATIISSSRSIVMNIRSSSSRRQTRSRLLLTANNDDDDNYGNDQEEEEDIMMPPSIDNFEDDEFDNNNLEDLQSMTVAQIKQQLRLRGKKVSGNKSQLIERLLEKGKDGIISDDGGGGGGDNSVDNNLQSGYSKYDKPFTASKQNSESSSSTSGGGSSDGSTNNETTNKAKVEPKRVAEAKARGADIVDVTDFVEVEEVGKAFRSSDRKATNDFIDAKVMNDVGDETNDDDTNDKKGNEEEKTTTSSSPEVWGEDARIVDDYEGRSIVVDGLSRTVIEYTGCNNTVVQAYVVGSRDSLKNFLKGGQHQQQQQQQAASSSDDEDDDDEDATNNKKKKSKNTPTTTYSTMEEEVYAIQQKRETQSKRGQITPDQVLGQDNDPTDTRANEYNTIERDYGDWGVYTPTGAQMSSTEVQGVLFLSDVYGPFTEGTQQLVDKIAFECQPVVVMVPDLFRGRPWTTNPIIKDDGGVERNEDGKSYEEWRATHPEGRVDIDIRAAAAVLRERYAVSSIAVWGTCYGGGRALEAAAGWYPGGPDSYYEDALLNPTDPNRRPAPPHVDPIAAIAWYPTRYDATKLFGRDNEGFRTFESGKDRSCAVMAVFAEHDDLAGATPDDAMVLKACLDDDPRISDSMVKVFPDQKHGFAHVHLGAAAAAGGEGASGDGQEQDAMDDRFLGEDFGTMDPLLANGNGGGDAEVACLLSTAWMETYTRVFLPTVGPPVRFDADERWSTLEMEDYSKKERREVRADLEEAIAKYEDVNVEMERMQSASPLMDGPGSPEFDKIEEERENIRQQILEKYDISEDDDDETFDRKFQQARDDGALDGLLLDAYMDDSGDAYW